jgi:hypothetical protein
VGRHYVPTSPWKLIGGAGPILSTPDGAAWAPGEVGSFLVEMRFTMSDWTPAGGAIVARHGFTDGNLAWAVEIQAGGRPRASYYPAGTLASRVGTECAVDPGLTDGDDVGLRVGFLANLLGVASAYSYDIQRGGSPWVPLGPAVLGAGPIVPFNSTEAVRVGEPASMTELHSFRVYGATAAPRRLDAAVGSRPGDTSWTDRATPAVVWSRGTATFARSDRPVPYASR